MKKGLSQSKTGLLNTVKRVLIPLTPIIFTSRKICFKIDSKLSSSISYALFLDIDHARGN